VKKIPLRGQLIRALFSVTCESRRINPGIEMICASVRLQLHCSPVAETLRTRANRIGL
jgi:hypothetical protein